MSVPKEMPIEWLISRIGDYTDDAILITEAEPIDAPGPRIVWCNAAFTKMTGYHLDDIRGLSPRILQGEGTELAALRKIRAALEKWQKVRVDLKNYRKDGSAFWVDLGIHPVADENGWFHYWISIQREMPDRHQSQDPLRRTNTVAEKAPFALGLVDAQMRLVFANDHFRTLVFDDELPPALPFPYEAWLSRGLTGRPAGSADPAQSSKWINQHVSALWSGRSCIQQELDGVWYEFRCIEMVEGEHLIIGENIEDKVSLQQQVRQMTKLDAMGQLTSGVAHDFNNILAVILGNAELAQTDGLPIEEKEEFIKETIDAAKKGRKLTQSLLSFARKSHMSPETVSIEKLATEAAKMFKRASGTGLKVSVQHETGLPAVTIDAGLMQTALLNLMINSRDAMSSGGEVTVSISVDRNMTLPNPADEARGVDAVKVSVIDKGKGMTESVRARAIEPFYSTKKTGSGLGLSMVHGFVEQSGGRMEIQSAPDAGTTISLYLPSDSGETRKNQVEMQGENFDLKGRTILIVEDEVAVRRLLARIVESAGARVIEAETGDEAYEHRARWTACDLLLSDVVMPGDIQGDVLARHFSSAFPEKPVMLLTGNPDMVRETLQTSEKFELLTKPVERTRLLRSILRLLGPTES